ncbi:uncharacterized protein LOC124306936 isoform X3 [Neodiprion virginianus]|uniref:uncharacterized protein LOC124306936 isoform X3 n=1 Tax=Neodiprion virginianus TaxID=2961670 RepID=UPI001EE70A62|nr:uncharacterized protein LOC124306936 isoform X3 [Neodiprion virginianus]
MRRYNRKLELQVFGPFPIRLDFTGIHHTRPIHDSLFLPEDEVVVIEHLPGRRVHLQDFFWTGADDAPPWLNPDQTLTLYEPRTVHHTATVYLPADGKGEDDDQGCANCIDPTPTLSDVDQDIGILIGDDPGPRYWLLTVLRAGETVPPRVELRLARLYKAAFSRQQKKHLGILSHSARLRRAAWRITGRDNRQKRDGQRAISKTESQVKASMSPESLLESGQTVTKNIDPAPETVKVKQMRAVKIPRRDSVILDTDNESDYLDVAKDRHDPQQLADKIPIISNLARPVSHDATVLPSGEQDPVNNSTLSHFLNTSTIHTRHEQTSRSQEINFEKDANSSEPFEATQAKLRNLEVGKVQVMMQNMSLTEDGATRLIYSVHLGGEPVPAASAARDMALLSEQEVALELGAPVIIQSEPYLKETRPLALSRRRDAWVLIGAAAAALMILIVVFIGLIFLAKRKRAQSAVAAPPPESILKRQTDYVSDTPGLDNTGYTSETEQRTEGTSQRLSAGSRHGSPLTPGTPESVVADIHQDLTDEEEEVEELKARSLTPWGGQEYAAVLKRQRPGRRRVTQTNAVDHPRTPDSMDVADALTTLENGHIPQKSNPKEDLTTSPHSYLSMPSCKQFPRIRSVEPLSRVLEPVVVRHLDMEFDSPEMQRKNDDFERGDNETYLIRSSSVMNDPGVVGPIVWDLRRQKAVEGFPCSQKQLVPRRIWSNGFQRLRVPWVAPGDVSTNSSRTRSLSSATGKPSQKIRPPTGLHRVSRHRSTSKCHQKTGASLPLSARLQLLHPRRKPGPEHLCRVGGWKSTSPRQEYRGLILVGPGGRDPSVPDRFTGPTYQK